MEGSGLMREYDILSSDRGMGHECQFIWETDVGRKFIRLWRISMFLKIMCCAITFLSRIRNKEPLSPLSVHIYHCLHASLPVTFVIACVVFLSVSVPLSESIRKIAWQTTSQSAQSCLHNACFFTAEVARERRTGAWSCIHFTHSPPAALRSFSVCVCVCMCVYPAHYHTLLQMFSQMQTLWHQ